MARISAVIVEDEILIRMYTRRQLERLGVEIVGETGKSEEVIPLIHNTRPDIVFMDIRIEGDRDGMDLAGDFAERMKIPVVFVSAYELGANVLPNHSWCLGVIQKPLSAPAARQILRQLESQADA
jgi:DNA-binding NarL/FixJ family response regulator